MDELVLCTSLVREKMLKTIKTASKMLCLADESQAKKVEHVGLTRRWRPRARRGGFSLLRKAAAQQRVLLAALVYMEVRTTCFSHV